MKNMQVIKFLPWDSNFFGYPIGQLVSDNLDQELLSLLEKESRELNLKCLYWLTKPTNPAAIQLAESNGFRYMDVKLTLEYQPISNAYTLTPVELPKHKLRTAHTSDIPILKDIARNSHHNTRFYADPNFKREDCDRLYEVWIENSLTGYAQQVFIAENVISSKPEAYITCHLEAGKGRIGLIAVHPAARDQHIGSGLLQKGLDWFLNNGASAVEVVTQWISRPAVNLYQKAGFQASDFQLWFHKWFQPIDHGENTNS